MLLASEITDYEDRHPACVIKDPPTRMGTECTNA
jgi:hypothetical protein